MTHVAKIRYAYATGRDATASPDSVTKSPTAFTAAGLSPFSGHSSGGTAMRFDRLSLLPAVVLAAVSIAMTAAAWLVAPVVDEAQEVEW